MGKRKGRPKQESTTPVQIRIPDSVLAALEVYARGNRRTRNQEILIAIEDRLRAAGCWPGQDKEPGAK